jgi:hypothetical protein
MILTDNHYFFAGLAGPQANVTFYDAFFTTLATGILGHTEAP